MAIQFPQSRKEVADRTKTDVQTNLPQSNPFLRSSFMGALIVGFAGRIYDFYLQAHNIIKEAFAQTATGIYLNYKGNLMNVSRNAATQATGYCTIEGTPTIEIPKDTSLQSLNGDTYKTTASKTITANSLSITTLARSGQIVTATTVSDHNLSPQINVTISGADQTEYNITTPIISVPAADRFQYEIIGTPVTPATGTIKADFNSAILEVLSDGFGEDQNLSVGAQLALSTPISGINDSAYVQYSEIGGGTDIESDADYRVRVIERYQNPVALFNVAAIVNQAKEIAGVTRVWVDQITPDIGQVTTHFVRDNDENIIPTPSEVATVKTNILLIKPANTDDDDVIVNAPTPVNVNFVFASLDPNTTSMRDAVTESLQELFSEDTNVGEDLEEDAYRSAIFNSVDSETGQRLKSYSLTSPAGDIPIAEGELATLGSITFP